MEPLLTFFRQRFVQGPSVYFDKETGNIESKYKDLSAFETLSIYPDKIECTVHVEGLIHFFPRTRTIPIKGTNPEAIIKSIPVVFALLYNGAHIVEKVKTEQLSEGDFYLFHNNKFFLDNGCSISKLIHIYYAAVEEVINETYIERRVDTVSFSNGIYR